jgi:hypothetical protein
MPDKNTACILRYIEDDRNVNKYVFYMSNHGTNLQVQNTDLLLFKAAASRNISKRGTKWNIGMFRASIQDIMLLSKSILMLFKRKISNRKYSVIVPIFRVSDADIFRLYEAVKNENTDISETRTTYLQIFLLVCSCEKHNGSIHKHSYNFLTKTPYERKQKDIYY